MHKILQSFDNKLLQASLNICQAVKAAGGQAYFVGGCVRDGLLGIDVTDADIEVYNLESELLPQVLAKAGYLTDLVGKTFAVFKVKHLNIDVSVPRVETKIAAGHKAFEVVAMPNLAFKEAALRRDFTINSMLFEPITGQLIDEYNGLADLDAKILKAVSAKFSEDPLRVLRAMQFIARFGFSIDHDTLLLCQELKQYELSRERIFEEWKKMLLKGKHISKGLNFLRDSGWLKYYPEMDALINCPQDKRWHPEGDVWSHTLICLDAFAHIAEHLDLTKQDKLIVGLALIGHDFGKVSTTIFQDEKISSATHEIFGVPLMESFLERLCNQAEIIETCKNLVRYHMQPYALHSQQSSDNAIRRLSFKMGRLDLLYVVCRADYLGSGPKDFNTEIKHIDWLQAKAEQIGVNSRNKVEPIILGRHIMERGVSPSPAYKTILSKCFEAQLNGKFLELEQGLLYLDQVLKQLQSE